MIHSQFELKTPDNLSLSGRIWRPEDKTDGVVCLVHGLGEHSGRYGQLAAFLAKKTNFATLAFDLRGHGTSQGKLGHTPTYEALLIDIDHLITEAKTRFKNLPCFLYGHSLGGNLVLNYALRCKPQLNGIIASSPWISLAYEPSKIKVTLAKTMNRLFPFITFSNGLNTHNLSQDPKVVYAYKKDPLVHNRISSRLFLTTYQSGLELLENAGKLSIPLLLMHGSSDKITSHKACKEFASHLTCEHTLKIFEGFYHELHNEPDYKDVLSFLSDWLISLI